MTNNNTVLIVDDQLSAREVLRGLLIGEGYNLFFAANGQEALAQAREICPDIILLDVMMPGMNGFEVCEHLRADPHLAEVPVLLVTALDDRSSRLQGIRAGADDFIAKPFDQTELRARVQTIIKLNRYRRLHMERAKFEWAIEKAHYGYVIIDGHGLITYANAQACQYLGLNPDVQFPTQETFLELSEKKYNYEPKNVWTAWPKLSTIEAPAYLVSPASEQVDSLWLQVEQMDMSSGADEKYLIHLRDVTNDISTQRLIWTFHAQIGHKLRTPVMLISGFLDMLEADDESLSESHRQLITSAYRNALRLQSEIQDVLRYLDTPHVARMGQEPCKLSEILEIVEEIKPHLELDNIQVCLPPAYSNGASEKLRLPLSRQATELILQELIRNSKKFHPNQSPSVEVKVISTDRGLSLQVMDDGITLLPEQLLRIWTPYYQAERFFTGQVSGMGLGLASVASMVWDVGGTCRAYNRADDSGLIIELALPHKLKGDQPA